MKASRAFTIFELLVVIAIMAILGAVAIANYRAIERGVAERAAMRSMNQFIRAAYHRAQIDKVPVAVFYWNETIQSESSFAPLTVVGKAVAVRRAGRFTKVDGDMLCDEFNDLQYFSSSYVSSEKSTRFIYRMGGKEGNSPNRTRVTHNTSETSLELRGADATDRQSTKDYGYTIVDGGGVDWKIGDAYGTEFLDITLPHNFIFGKEYSKSVSEPVAGRGILRFKVSPNTGSGARGGVDGASTVVISNIRPDKTGAPKVFRSGETIDPTEKMDKR